MGTQLQRRGMGGARTARALAHARIVALGGLSLGLALARPAVVAGQDADQVRSVLVSLAQHPEIAGEVVPKVEDLARIYEGTGFAPLWSGERADVLRDVVLGAATDGLDPTAYHLAAIDALAKQTGGEDPPASAELDVLRTSAVIQLARDLRWGRARPASVPAVSAAADRALVARVVGAPDLAAAIDALRPAHFVYRGLVEALARLRGIERAGGWAPLPPGAVLREGDVGDAVMRLRERLAVEGYRADASPASAHYDAMLAEVVRSFQHHHGLNEDGIVGEATRAELDVPVAARIAQVAVNLERARWITPMLPDTFLVVNVAGAKLYLVRDGTIAHETRVIVGTEYTRTPVFSSRMQQVELNPYWTVPRSIVQEVLDEARGDPTRLARQGMRALDLDGQPIDLTDRELASFTEASFPWTLRQDPGPLNPLGRIKFVFPNDFSVYLHDTPRRELFGREERLFSHGCIRVQDPLALAALLLDEPGRWDRNALERAVATGAHQVIPFRRPVFILIQYWTASTDEHGALHFYRDVYERDDELRRELSEGVR